MKRLNRREGSMEDGKESEMRRKYAFYRRTTVLLCLIDSVWLKRFGYVCCGSGLGAEWYRGP